MDVVTVCPPWVLGPLLQPTVNTTSMRLVAYLTGSLHWLSINDLAVPVLNIYVVRQQAMQ